MTIGLKSVENPLEFGIVVTDEDGRIERFLEKPSWGQVFSDTINTGIYVVEPEVLRHIPTDRPYDFSKELFPLLLEMGRPMYGYVMRRLLAGHRQPRPVPAGELRRARRARAAQHLRHPHPRQRLGRRGRRPRTTSTRSRGRRSSATTAASRPMRRSARTRCSATSVTLRERARTSRSIVDASTYDRPHRRSSRARSSAARCDLRAHIRVHEGVAIGDEVTIGAESVIMPGVRIYPYKEVETGSQIFESLIWESRGTTRIFGKERRLGSRQRRPDTRRRRASRVRARHRARSAARASSPRARAAPPAG